MSSDVVDVGDGVRVGIFCGIIVCVVCGIVIWVNVVCVNESIAVIVDSASIVLQKFERAVVVRPKNGKQHDSDIRILSDFLYYI